MANYGPAYGTLASNQMRVREKLLLCDVLPKKFSIKRAITTIVFLKSISEILFSLIISSFEIDSFVKGNRDSSLFLYSFFVYNSIHTHTQTISESGNRQSAKEISAYPYSKRVVITIAIVFVF
jgi:hypothetical protein